MTSRPRTLLLLVAGTLALAAITPLMTPGARAADENEAVAVVDGKTITRGELEKSVRAQLIEIERQLAEARELLDDPDMRESAIDLMASSAELAINRLKFYRLAFGGSGGSDVGIGLAEALASLAALEQRQTQDRDFGRLLASELEDIDMAEAITNLQQDELQLEASLNVTARLNELSLLRFI